MILEVSNLSHGFGDRAIFDNVSFRLLKGEHIGLIGANGEGKSTFMNIITGKIFSEMAANGYRDLKLHFEEVNNLNVFPVPDGDTGTNIAATLNGGVKAVKNAENETIGNVAEQLAGGMLLGARGNSGVIVSQFFQDYNESHIHG